MRICLVHRDIHQVTRGGICTVYRALAERLAARGHRITVLTQQTPHPIRVRGGDLVMLPRTDDLAMHRRGVAEALERLRPDVVDCSTWEAEALDYLRGGHADRAPVAVRGDLSAHTMGIPSLAAAERELVCLADQLVAVSEFAARDLAAAYRVPAPQVIPNGVDRGRFWPGPPHPPTSGYKIQLDTSGQSTQAVALSDLLDRGRPVPPWSPDPQGRLDLVWVGKITPMKGWDRLEQLARQLRHIARITVLLGHARAHCPVSIDGRGEPAILHDLDDGDMPSLYRAADWLLCTSRWEGFGLSIVEALACGTPALLPERLGIGPELLAAGGGVTYRDADHLAHLLGSTPPPSGRLPASFDWDANTTASLAIYQQLAVVRQR